MFFWLIAIVLVVSNNAIHFETNWELVHALQKQGFPDELLADFVCLINAESKRMTDLQTEKHGIEGYGLFQINDTWCSRTYRRGKGCNIPCAELMTNDITKAATCAKTIYEHQNFEAWQGWRHDCKGRLPSYIPKHYKNITAEVTTDAPLSPIIFRRSSPTEPMQTTTVTKITKNKK